MPSQFEEREWSEGWPGIGLVAITYIYFLIFAQFGFLKRLAVLGIAGDQLKIIMGAMAVGGIVTSLLTSRFEGWWHPVRRLQAGFIGCAIGATLTLVPMNLIIGTMVSVLIGAALGLLTVTLVTHLQLWIGMEHPLLKIGSGVGLAYFACNFPPLFDASPEAMAMVSTLLCFFGIGLATRITGKSPGVGPVPTRQDLPPFWLVLSCFTALVWLDSAAFFIIQNTPELRSVIWESPCRLWQNGGVHFLAALGSGAMLSRRGLFATLFLAFLSLACACLILVDSGRSALAVFFYPMGVSLYSVALVAYPSYLAPTNSAFERTRSAGRLYAVAGWLGSALGIGMAQNLRRIPPIFVFLAAVLFFVPRFWRYFRTRRRELSATVVLLLAARGLQCLLQSPGAAKSASTATSAVERGREVYIAEGCIHCHSQYVRPNSRDEIIWGPAADAIVRRAEEPPLIGNRRQGPDLTEIGNRRSALWLRAHFMNPAMLSHNSPMPAYAYLFADERGETLLAYLQSLGKTNAWEHWGIAQEKWRSSNASLTAAQGLDGNALLQKHCATCHAPDGLTRKTWKSHFNRLPPDFVAGPFVCVPAGTEPYWRLQRVCEIIKFGLAGTDMPGHEYLPDGQVVAIAEQVIRLAAVETNKESLNHFWPSRGKMWSVNPKKRVVDLFTAE